MSGSYFHYGPASSCGLCRLEYEANQRHKRREEIYKRADAFGELPTSMLAVSDLSPETDPHATIAADIRARFAGPPWRPGEGQ